MGGGTGLTDNNRKKSLNMSELLHEVAYFCPALRGAALLLRSGPKESRCNISGEICNDLHNQTTTINTIIQW